MAPHRPHRADGKTECGPFSLPCDSVVRPAVCRAWWPAGGVRCQAWVGVSLWCFVGCARWGHGLTLFGLLRTPQARGLIRTRNALLTGLEAAGPRPVPTGVGFQGRPSPRLQTAASHCVLTRRNGVWELSAVSFIRALIPITRAPPFGPNLLLKIPPHNTIALGLRISTHEFGGLQMFRL